jgi:hypothetical protein
MYERGSLGAVADWLDWQEAAPNAAHPASARQWRERWLRATAAAVPADSSQVTHFQSCPSCM